MMSPVSVGAGALEERLKQFAFCVGRLSAEMEDQWMFDGPASEKTLEKRTYFDDLVDATLPIVDGVSGRDVLAWRVNAKIAHAQLLHEARFGNEDWRVLRARRLAARQIMGCEAMLLS